MSEVTLPRGEFDNANVTIEHAKPEDAEAIMAIKRDASLAAYPNQERGVTPQDIIKKFTNEYMSEGFENWRRGIATEVEGGNRRTFVASVGGEVVGYTSPYIEDGQQRIGQLYVAPAAQRKGIGNQLLRQALEWLDANQEVRLHVVSYNEPAINLYKKFGFEYIGDETPEQFDKNTGLKLLPEIEMLRKPVH